MPFLITSVAVRFIYEGDKIFLWEIIYILKQNERKFEILFKKVCKIKEKFVFRLCLFI